NGTADITASEAFAAWDLAQRHCLDYAAVLRTLPAEPGQRRPSILSELPLDTPEGAQDSAPEADAPWVGLGGEELWALLSSEVCDEVAQETQMALSEVDPDQSLSDMGLDSVMTVRIRRGLERRFALPLPATLFWDRPTGHAVTDLPLQDLHHSGGARAARGR